GETVLIHAGAGGVGLAAIAVARDCGARIIATAGSEQKRALLRDHGVATVGDSRSADFVDAVREATGGRGVDVALNMLSGVLVPATMDIVAQGGRFVELGKRDVWDADATRAYRPDIAFESFDLVSLAEEDPDLVRGHLEAVIGPVDTREGPSIPVATFAFEDAREAFREMSQARHRGKLVCARHAAFRPRRDGCYVITGGFGALGAVTARRLAAEGAGAVVLVGRSAPSDTGKSLVTALEAMGAQVLVELLDVACPDAVTALAERLQRMPDLPIVRGIFHAAGHLEDGLLADQDDAAMARVLAPKRAGSLALAGAFAGAPLEAFVLFSSAVATLGAAGQGAYAAANGFLDSLARTLRRQGIPATAIGWGPWDEAGMAARLDAAGRERMARRGLEPLPPERALDAMMLLAGRAGPAHALVLRRRSGVADTGHRSINAEQPAASTAPEDTEAEVLRIVAAVMGGSAAEVAPRRTFKELGFDSLMAVELRGALAKRLGLSLPATLIFDFPTAAELIDHLRARLAATAPEVGDAHGDDRDLAKDADPASAPTDGAHDATEETEEDLLAKLDAKVNEILGSSVQGGVTQDDEA
ncbi:MAG: SDR family NAD(P)-dependent oxidoreductase, partial [Pseudomonadota bacterium]